MTRNLRRLELRFIAGALMMALAPLAVLQGQNQPAPEVKLTVRADREDAVYRAGETATFTVTATRGNQPVASGRVACLFSEDGWKPRELKTVTLEDGKATVSATLDKPGFLRLRASMGKTAVLAGAAYDPEKVTPSLPVPDDFDEFWKSQKSALAKVEARATLSPVKSPVPGVEAFDVQVDALGQPVSGYFGRPQNAKPKSLPAILFVHGAGVRSANLGRLPWVNREGGVLVLDINAHGIPNGKPASYYTELSQGELRDYRGLGRDDREQCYFKGMFLRVVRAIDFLTSQPEWDGKTLIVYGSSQGGFQAFAAAGLDDRVTYICAGVPAGCDHTGSAADRISGWPKLVPNGSDGKPNAAALQASRYFDCVNFATRAKCQGAAVTVGFIDVTCPPTSVYAAYNALTIPKAMHADVAAGHTNTPQAVKFMDDAAVRHIRAMKK